MRTIKNLTGFFMVVAIVLNTVFVLPTVNAEEIPPYDYSSFVGTWYDDKGLELYIFNVNGNSVTLQFEGEHFSNTYPIIGNTVTWDESKKNWNITCSLTFNDDSIYMVRNGAMDEAFSEQYNNPESFYEEYWFTSKTIKPHKIITGNYSILLNGVKLEFDQPPVMCNDRILVPMRKIFEELGAIVNYNSYIDTTQGHYNAEEIQITATTQTSKLWLSRRWFGDWQYSVYKDDNYISGATISSQTGDVPPLIINGRTLVPVRLISEALGANVEWDNETQTVIITTL